MSAKNIGRRRAIALWCSLACSWSAASASAHQPHDSVRQILPSPNYAQDGILFALATDIPLDEEIILRSTDRGITWRRMRRGLDRLSEVLSLCISPNFASDGVVFATAKNRGVYVSQDAGLSWTRTSYGGVPSQLLFSACSVDALGNVVLLVADANGGVSRTQDLGATWQLLSPSHRVTAFEFSPTFAGDRLVVAGDDSGRLFVSTDGGLAWKLVTTLPGAGRIYDIELAPGTGSAFVATAAGLYRTTDGAKTFTSVNPCLPDEGVITVAVSPTFVSDGTVFCGTVNEGVFKSTDGGACWTDFHQGIEFDPLLTLYRFFDLEVSPDFASDGTVFAALFEGGFRSTNGGTSWFPLETLTRGTLEDLAISPDFAADSTLALAYYGGGVLLSTDGGTSWAIANRGIANTYVYSIAFSPSYALDGTLFCTHVGRRVLESNDRGANWQLGEAAPLVFSNKIGVSPAFSVDGTVFVGSRDALHRSLDGGDTWTQVLASSDSIHTLELSPSFASDGTLFVAGVFEGVRRSRDAGITWDSAHSGLPGLGGRGHLLALSPAFASDQRIFAGTLQGLFESTDAGDNWSVVPVAGLALDVPIDAMALSPDFDLDGVALVSTRGLGLFRTSDGGANWTEVGTELLDANVVLQRIRFSPDFSLDQTLFGFCDSELFRSLDAGLSWEEIHRNPVRHEDNVEHQWTTYESLGTPGGSGRLPAATSQPVVACDGHSIQGAAGDLEPPVFPELRSAGSWESGTVTGASARWIHYSFSIGAQVRFFFVGTGVEWIGLRSQLMGIAEVTLDGVVLGTVDQFGTSFEAMVKLYSVSGLANGLHELVIVSTDQSSGGGFGLAVDAFDVTE